MKFSPVIQGRWKINSIDFGDPLTFHLAPSSDQSFNLPNTLV